MIALAVAAPAAAASAAVEVGAFQLDGTCGALSLGLLNTGFTLTAGPSAPLPAGTSVTITGTGVANIGVFSIVPSGLATVTVLSPVSRQITLTSEVPANTTVAFSTLLSVAVLWTLTATASLPSGYVGTGSKGTGTVNGTLVLCSAT